MINVAKGQSHPNRCKNCKTNINALLKASFGNMEERKKIDIHAPLSSYGDSLHYAVLKNIYKALQKYRGHENFVRRKKLSPVDFFIANQSFILEFDERQHFTTPRRIALSLYPKNFKFGFDRELWMKLCKELDEHDPEPEFRDEQRAWYDTLRDFAPYIATGKSKLKPTVRILDADPKIKKLVSENYFEWCGLNPSRLDDIKKFKQLIGK